MTPTDEQVREMLDTPDAQGRFHGYYDFGHGVNEAEKIRQDLVGMLYAGWTCPDCSDEPGCPTHALACERIERLAELAGATWYGSPPAR